MTYEPDVFTGLRRRWNEKLYKKKTEHKRALTVNRRRTLVERILYYIIFIVFYPHTVY